MTERLSSEQVHKATKDFGGVAHTTPNINITYPWRDALTLRQVLLNRTDLFHQMLCSSRKGIRKHFRIEGLRLLNGAKEIFDSSCELGEFDKLEKSRGALSPMESTGKLPRVFPYRFFFVLGGRSVHLPKDAESKLTEFRKLGGKKSSRFTKIRGDSSRHSSYDTTLRTSSFTKAAYS